MNCRKTYSSRQFKSEIKKNQSDFLEVSTLNYFHLPEINCTRLPCKTTIYIVMIFFHLLNKRKEKKKKPSADQNHFFPLSTTYKANDMLRNTKKKKYTHKASSFVIVNKLIFLKSSEFPPHTTLSYKALRQTS